ncbi:tyrosine-type recombinase/integrase [Enterococcus sp. DIV0187]|uniref:tyrosine-type recombinase/integrase n=1 Tax=Enterococcus sp. DIV0187 TaxID=2774644 RepID=UPI003F255258
MLKTSQKVKGEVLKVDGRKFSGRQGIVKTGKYEYAFNYIIRDENKKDVIYSKSSFKHVEGTAKLLKKYDAFVKKAEDSYRKHLTVKENKLEELKLKETKKTQFNQYIKSEEFLTEYKKNYTNSSYNNNLANLYRLQKKNKTIFQQQFYDISTADITKMLNKIDKDNTVATTRKYYYSLNKAFKIALRMNNIPLSNNPCLGYEFDRDKAIAEQEREAKKDKRNVLDVNEEKYVISNLEKLDKIYEVGFRFVLLTGVRNGEFLGLEWDAIDFENKTISIHQVLTEAEGNRQNTVINKYTKNKGKRIIPLYKELEEILIDWKKYQDDVYSKFDVKHEELEYDLVFAKQDGQSYNLSRFSSEWLKFRKDIKLGKETTFHNLRGTYISRCLNNKGIPATVVQALSGHKTLDITTIYYNEVSVVDIKALVSEYFI